VARGALKPKVTQPEEEHFDLRAWRQSRGLTQFALAETLRVDRSIISKVETGEKLIPRNWEPILAKM
jgi:transcriptional regulator with XRE-family HTH domain